MDTTPKLVEVVLAILLMICTCEIQRSTACKDCTFGVAKRASNGTLYTGFGDNATEAFFALKTRFPENMSEINSEQACALNACGRNSTCSQTSSLVFTCGCQTGFEKFPTNETFACSDIDECAEGTHNCSVDGDCSNTEGGFNCICKSGFIGNGHICTDIDECVEGTHDCSATGDCSNTEGGFNCTCKPGFTGDGRNCTDLDECTLGSHNCSTYGYCSNTQGGFTCTCAPGLSGDGYSCTDIDECVEGTYNCSANGDCFNTEGGFNCTCKPGFTGDGRNCTDVTNECLLGTHNCSRNATCKDTPTGFICSCNQGYTGDGHDCADIDECAASLCHQNATCVNAQGSYKCICEAGYNYTGHNCSDVDECVGFNQCHRDADCTNSPRSYRCDCKPGFIGDGYNCSDINECEFVNCTGNCYNVGGGFHCECKGIVHTYLIASRDVGQYSFDLDFVGNKNSCISYPLNCSYEGSCNCNASLAEVNGVCKLPDGCMLRTRNCDNDATCAKDLDGPYSCKCNIGFIGDGYNCTDIDECLSISPPCTNCTNTNGGYSCGCEPGFTGDLCQDIDECAEGIHKCHPRATCTNTEGSYNCTCQDDYYVEGDNGTWCSGCPNSAWTDWINSDIPDSYYYYYYYHYFYYYPYYFLRGDYELHSLMKKRFPNLNICANPTNAEAQTDDGRPYRETGNQVHMSVDGLWCVSDEQLYRDCANYIVRFCCPEENELPTSTPTTAPSGEKPPWFRSSGPLTSKIRYKCSTSSFLVTWVKSVTENSFYNYKLIVKDTLTNTTKVTSVEILFRDDPTIQITESKAKPGFCITQTTLEISDKAEVTVDLTVGWTEGDNFASAATVVHKYPTNTYKFLIFDAA